MSKEMSNDTFDFKSATPTLQAGRIRIDGGSVIVHTSAGEVTIPLASLLASTNNGEGASLIGMRNPSNQFATALLESIIPEIKTEIDSIASSGFTPISPHTLFSAGAGGIGPTTFNLAGVLPAEATHGVFEGTCFSNGLSSGSAGWYGYRVNGTNFNSTSLNMFGTPALAGTEVKTVVLPLLPGRQSKWDAGIDSGSTITIKCVGWLGIVGGGLTPAAGSH